MRFHTVITRTVQRVCGVGAVALALAVVIAATPAKGQVKDVEPYHVVVTGDHVYLRCGAGGVWYAIGYANTGDLLRVDAEGYAWMRIAYPKNVAALVSAEDADYDADLGVVVITRPTRLKANNIHGKRLGDSWKNLLPSAQKPGATLNYIDTLRNEDGQIEGYLVQPPLGAQAFISEKFTRRATPTEVAAHLARQQKETDLALKSKQPTKTLASTPAPAVSPSSGSPADTSAKDGSVNTIAATPGSPMNPTQTNAAPTADSTTQPTLASPAQPAATTNSPSTPAETTLRIDNADQTSPVATDDSPDTQTFSTPAETTAPDTLAAANVVDADDSTATSTDGESALPAPGRTIPQINTGSSLAGTSTPAADATPAVASTPTPIPTFKQLESAFVALSKEPIEDAEIAPLIAEFGRLRSTLTNAEADKDQLLRIDQRLDLLDVRLSFQKNLRALNAVSEQANADAETMRLRLAELDKSRAYSLVGRLSASAIYDGQRLPFMYRLQSVEGGAGRTIAYIMPNKDLDLNGKLGSIVGVEGESNVDAALNLRIVTPTRVDLLTPALSSVTTPDQP